MATKQLPLTPSMILGLKSACLKQSAGILYGPVDIKKSTSLIRRGLIKSHLVIKDDKNETSWQVTSMAIEMLRDLGIVDKC